MNNKFKNMNRLKIITIHKVKTKIYKLMMMINNL